MKRFRQKFFFGNPLFYAVYFHVGFRTKKLRFFQKSAKNSKKSENLKIKNFSENLLKIVSFKDCKILRKLENFSKFAKIENYSKFAKLRKNGKFLKIAKIEKTFKSCKIKR